MRILRDGSRRGRPRARAAADRVDDVDVETSRRHRPRRRRRPRRWSRGVDVGIGTRVTLGERRRELVLEHRFAVGIAVGIARRLGA